MNEKKFHCLECAGHAKAKGESCSECDGEGNPLQVKQKSEKVKNPAEVKPLVEKKVKVKRKW